MRTPFNPQCSASLQGSFDYVALRAFAQNADSAQDDNSRQKISFSSDSLDQSAPSCRFSVLRKHLVILSAASSNELAESKDPFPLNSALGPHGVLLNASCEHPSTAKQCKRAGILRLRCPSRIRAKCNSAQDDNPRYRQRPLATRASTSLTQIVVLISKIVPRVAHDCLFLRWRQLPPELSRRAHPQRAGLDNRLLGNQRSRSDN
jgi:hypothetical protein